MRKSRKYIKQDLRGHDFSGQNLRGVRFVECDLQGANFDSANLRSVHFQTCNLASASLQQAFFGVQRAVSLAKEFFAFAISTTLTFWAMFFNVFLFEFIVFAPYETEWLAGIMGILIAMLFLFLYIRYGYRAFIVAVAVAGAVAFTGAFVFAVTGAVVNVSGFAAENAGEFAFNVALAGTVIFIFIIGVAFASGSAVSVTIIESIGAFVGALVSVGAIVFIYFFVSVEDNLSWHSLVFGSLFQVIMLSISKWQIRHEDKRSRLLITLHAWWKSQWGTRFRNCNLKEADFRHASLRNVDLYGATLDRVRWKGVTTLPRARLPRRYREELWLKPLLISLAAPEQVFDGFDLSKLNLAGADLRGASFVDANLNQCDLRGADLTGANLTRAQLESSDLRGATLTGAYIEDWNITRSTLLDGVVCDYIYMHDPSQADATPLRKPDDYTQTFAPGDFADFIKPLYDTLDLYHSHNVDIRAVAISINRLQDSYPDAGLEILSIERRGAEGIVVRYNTDPTADKSELGNYYYRQYHELKLLTDRERAVFEARLDEKDRVVQSMIQDMQRYSQITVHGNVNIASGRGVIVDGDVGGTIVTGNENIVAGENDAAKSIVAEGSETTGAEVAPLEDAESKQE